MYVQVLVLYGTNGICGRDYEGSPVWYHIASGTDFKGLLLFISKQELLKSKYQSCELLMHQCEQQTQKVSTRVPRFPNCTPTAALQHCAPIPRALLELLVLPRSTKSQRGWDRPKGHTAYGRAVPLQTGLLLNRLGHAALCI